MDKLIRRTVTITMIETWTFIWTPDDNPPSHPVTLVPNPAETEEETNENLQATVTSAEPSKSSASDRAATPLTPAAMLDPHPGSVPTRPAASGRSHRTRHRAASRTQPSD